MSSEKKVKTIKGEELPISQCKKFPEGYYKIGDINIENSGDCYFINSSHYRIETGRVIFNHSIKKYTIDTTNIVTGVVGFNNEEPIMGFFNYNPENEISVILKNNNSYLLLDESVIKDNKNYREQLSSGNYYHIGSLPASKFNKINIPSGDYKTSLPYDSRGITDIYLEKYKKNYKGELSEAVVKYGPILKNVSFGLEFETTRGFIPNRILNNLGLIPLRDGSISGIEYVTVPLHKEQGLQTVIDLLPELQKRTVYDDTCALHVHIGNVPRTKEFMLAFYKLTCSIQDEIYEMFPLYKKYNFGVKNKNYSKPYPVYSLLSQMDPVITPSNIDENFNILYQYLSGGENFFDLGCDLRNIKGHPSDPQGTQKWNIKTRYYLHNLIPLIFGNKTTVEFRIHTPTYDVNKIIPFILLSSILINYTIQEEKNILSKKGFLSYKSLYDIINTYINSCKVDDTGALYQSLSNYLTSRKQRVEQDNRNGNIVGVENEISGCKTIDWSKSKLDVYDSFNKPFKQLPTYFGSKSKAVVSGAKSQEIILDENDPFDSRYLQIVKDYQIKHGSVAKYMSDLENLKVSRKLYYEKQNKQIVNTTW